MNYIRLIHAFYEKQMIYNLSAGQISLWHALVSINNKCFWNKDFTVSNTTLIMLTGLSRSGINKNRTVLKEKGLINFTPHTTNACKYSITDISNYASSKETSKKSGKDSEQKNSTLINKNINKNNIYKKRAFCDDELSGEELERLILSKNEFYQNL